MSTDSTKAALEAQKKAAELQMQMQEKLLNGQINPAQIASEYMNALAGMMPDLATLQKMAAGDPGALTAENLDGYADDDEDNDVDYNDPNNLVSLFTHLVESMEAVAQIPSAPAQSVSDGDAKWAQMGVLCSGILSNINGHNLDGLYIEEPNDADYTEQIKEGLADAWGIESVEDLHKTLTWLSEEGHRTRYAAFCNAAEAPALMNANMNKEERAGVVRGFLFANQFKNKKSEQTMLGWDLGRFALLVRFGFYIGWLSKNEATTMLITIAKRLGKTYTSWQEFGNSYQFGAAFWKVQGDPNATKENNAAIAEAISELLTTDMFGAPGEWGTSPWLCAK